MFELIFLPIIVFLLIVAVSIPLLKRLHHPYNVSLFTFLFALLLTPSWGPATIVAVPMPFGAILGVGIYINALDEVLSLVTTFWWWHAIAFPITALIGYLIGKKLFAHNQSLQCNAPEARR